MVVQISQQLQNLNFPIGEVPKSYYMSGLVDTVAELNLVNIEYHQSVAQRQPNLVLKFACLEDLDDVYKRGIRRKIN